MYDTKDWRVTAELSRSRYSVHPVFVLYKITKGVVLLTFVTLRSHLEHHFSQICFFRKNIDSDRLRPCPLMYFRLHSA